MRAVSEAAEGKDLAKGLLDRGFGYVCPLSGNCPCFSTAVQDLFSVPRELLTETKSRVKRLKEKVGPLLNKVTMENVHGLLDRDFSKGAALSQG